MSYKEFVVQLTSEIEIRKPEKGLSMRVICDVTCAQRKFTFWWVISLVKYSNFAVMTCIYLFQHICFLLRLSYQSVELQYIVACWRLQSTFTHKTQTFTQELFIKNNDFTQYTVFLSDFPDTFFSSLSFLSVPFHRLVFVLSHSSSMCGTYNIRNSCQQISIDFNRVNLCVTSL